MAMRMGCRKKWPLPAVAMNQGVKRALEKELGCALLVSDSCQFTGALGAALLARQA